MTTRTKTPKNQLVLLGEEQEVVKYAEASQFVDNRFQPDDQDRLDDVGGLADSIFAVGLRVKLEARVVKATQVLEIIHGHRRKRAIELLASDGRLAKMVEDGRFPYAGVPYIERTATDAEMFLISQAENSERRDVNPVANLRAWQLALDTIKGMTVQKVAEMAHLDHSTVSTYLGLLGLPDAVLEQMRQGNLSLRAARELAALKTPDGRHDGILANVVEGLGRRDVALTRNAVREQLRSAVELDARFRPLEGRSSYAQGNETVLFDVEAFKTAHPDSVFRIPALGDGDDERLYTDNVNEWKKAQKKAAPKTPKAKATAAPTRGKTVSPAAPARETAKAKRERLAKEKEAEEAADKREADAKAEEAAEEARAVEDAGKAQERTRYYLEREDAADAAMVKALVGGAFDATTFRILALGLTVGQQFVHQHPDDESELGYQLEPAVVVELRELLAIKRPNDYASIASADAVTAVATTKAGEDKLMDIVARLVIANIRAHALDRLVEVGKSLKVDVPTLTQMKKDRLAELKAKAAAK